MKDIFIDNDFAGNFSNPIEEDVKALIRWLMNEGGVLAVSNKVLGEYSRTCASCSGNNIAMIIHRLTIDGRLNKISPKELKAFKFSKQRERKLRSNFLDHDHIRTVLLSKRRMAISEDEKLRYDINNFPGYDGRAVLRPSQIEYR